MWKALRNTCTCTKTNSCLNIVVSHHHSDVHGLPGPAECWHCFPDIGMRLISREDSKVTGGQADNCTKYLCNWKGDLILARIMKLSFGCARNSNECISHLDGVAFGVRGSHLAVSLYRSCVPVDCFRNLFKRCLSSCLCLIHLISGFHNYANVTFRRDRVSLVIIIDRQNDCREVKYVIRGKRTQKIGIVTLSLCKTGRAEQVHGSIYQK